MRKTDDLDVTFTKKSDMEGFSREVLLLLGKNYTIYHGKYTDSIVNRRTREKLIDMHVSTRYLNAKALEHAPRYVRGGYASTKNYAGGIRGDDPRVAAVKKYNAAAQSIIDEQTWRIEKDLFDSGLIGRAALSRAKRLVKTTKNLKQKKDLEKIICRYEAAMMKFSSDRQVMNIRKKAEKKYLRDGKITTKTFTDREKMRQEREIAKKYGVRGAYHPPRKNKPKAAGKRFVNLSKMI